MHVIWNCDFQWASCPSQRRCSNLQCMWHDMWVWRMTSRLALVMLLLQCLQQRKMYVTSDAPVSEAPWSLWCPFHVYNRERCNWVVHLFWISKKPSMVVCTWPQGHTMQCPTYRPKLHLHTTALTYWNKTQWLMFGSFCSHSPVATT